MKKTIVSVFVSALCICVVNTSFASQEDAVVNKVGQRLKLEAEVSLQKTIAQIEARVDLVVKDKHVNYIEMRDLRSLN